MIWRQGDDVCLWQADAGEALREACIEFEEDRALQILEEKITMIDIPSDTNMTALHCAASSGSLILIDALLQRGADIKARDRYNQSALHLAATAGHLNAIKLLITAGADLHAQSIFGDTVRDSAICSGDQCANKSGHVSIRFGYDLNRADKCYKVCSCSRTIPRVVCCLCFLARVRVRTCAPAYEPP